MQTDALVLLNVTVYAAAIAGAVVLKRRPPVPDGDGGDASFEALGDVLRSRFPELPPGFTLREGLAEARQVERDLDWASIDAALVDYEGYRYGGLPDLSLSQPAVSDLIVALRSRRSGMA